MKNMKKSKIGKVDYSDLKNPPEKHERASAHYCADKDFDVTFIRPSSIKGTKNPDCMIKGRIWELKSPTTYSDSSFEYNFKKASSQSKNIIFDLRRLNARNEQKYLKELIKRGNSRTIKALIVITRDGRRVDIKGKF